ncbi:MAG: hypothetical protein AAFR27_12350, partial [Pseudomonadota bacterium]
QEAGYAIRHVDAMQVNHMGRADRNEILTRVRRIARGDFDVFERNSDQVGIQRALRRLRGRAFRPPIRFLLRKNLITPLSFWDRVRYVGFRWQVRRAMYAAAQDYFAGGEAERR